mmetsp:Transcript_8904/g.19112  ORF Transcript_8904/g.19112 Transcript_8904/m.19112 type:complete len:255 (+) Transcript_8904:524-1288(+)
MIRLTRCVTLLLMTSMPHRSLPSPACGPRPAALFSMPNLHAMQFITQRPTIPHPSKLRPPKLQLQHPRRVRSWTLCGGPARRWRNVRPMPSSPPPRPPRPLPPRRRRTPPPSSPPRPLQRPVHMAQSWGVPRRAPLPPTSRPVRRGWPTQRSTACGPAPASWTSTSPRRLLTHPSWAMGVSAMGVLGSRAGPPRVGRGLPPDPPQSGLGQAAAVQRGARADARCGSCGAMCSYAMCSGAMCCGAAGRHAANRTG